MDRMGYRSLGSCIVRGFGLNDLGRAGLICQSGGGLSKEDRAVRTVLELNDVFADIGKPNHNVCVGLNKQRGLLFSADRAGM